MQTVPDGHTGGGKGVKPPQNGYCRLTGAAEVVAGGAGVVVDRVEVVNLVGVDEDRAVEGAGVGC